MCINNLDNPSLWIYDHRYSIRALPEEAEGNLSAEKWIQLTDISQNNRIIAGTLQKSLEENPTAFMAALPPRLFEKQ